MHHDFWTNIWEEPLFTGYFLSPRHYVECSAKIILFNLCIDSMRLTVHRRENGGWKSNPHEINVQCLNACTPCCLQPAKSLPEGSPKNSEKHSKLADDKEILGTFCYQEGGKNRTKNGVCFHMDDRFLYVLLVHAGACSTCTPLGQKNCKSSGCSFECLWTQTCFLSHCQGNRVAENN